MPTALLVPPEAKDIGLTPISPLKEADGAIVVQAVVSRLRWVSAVASAPRGAHRDIAKSNGRSPYARAIASGATTSTARSISSTVL